LNTFFRMSVYICFILLLISLCFNVVNTFDAFGVTDVPSGIDLGDTEVVLSHTTSLATPNMNYIIGLVGLGVAFGVGVGYLTSSIVPVGIGIFGSVFWASFYNTYTVLQVGSYVPQEILTMFTICTVLIFAAAIIGMTTGSG